MKKILKIFVLTVSVLSIVACGQMNTVIRPYTEIKQEVKDVQVIITRADRSGIYVAIKNNIKENIEIDWDKSTLGGVKITQGAYVDRTEHNIHRKNTTLKPDEIFKTVLHRENDIYYLDPVLYQPGGVRIEPLVYPTTLDLKIKKGSVETDNVILIKHEHSLDKKAVDARVNKEYDKEIENNAFHKTNHKLREDKIIVK